MAMPDSGAPPRRPSFWERQNTSESHIRLLDEELVAWERDRDAVLAIQPDLKGEKLYEAIASLRLQNQTHYDDDESEYWKSGSEHTTSS